jgi:hypothetical protein
VQRKIANTPSDPSAALQLWEYISTQLENVGIKLPLCRRTHPVQDREA